MDTMTSTQTKTSTNTKLIVATAFLVASTAFAMIPKLSTTTKFQSCKDPDAPISSTFAQSQLFTRSTTTYKSGSRTDYCYTFSRTKKTYVMEGVCKKGGFQTWQKNCGELNRGKTGVNYQCVQGACVDILATTPSSTPAGSLPDVVFFNGTPQFTHTGVPYILNIVLRNNGTADYVAPIDWQNKMNVRATWYDVNGTVLVYPENGTGPMNKTEKGLDSMQKNGPTLSFGFSIIPNQNARSVKIDIDPDNKYAEVNENNNSVTMTIPAEFILPINPTIAHSCDDVNAIPLVAEKYKSTCSSYGAVCYNKYSLEYQGCGSLDGNGCTSGNTNAARNMICSATSTTTPTTTASLTVSPSTLNVGSTAGGSPAVTLTSNVSWVVSDNQTWLSVLPASGSNNGTLTVSYTTNISTTSRTGTVTVTGGGITRTITVIQAGSSNNAYLNISPTSFSTAAPAGSRSVSVSSNASWTVTDNQDWLTVSPTARSNNGSFVVSYTVNTLTTSRSGVVTITGGGITKTVTVTQAGAISTPTPTSTPTSTP